MGGNVLLVVLGRLHQRIGVSRRRANAMTALGVFGLVWPVGFLALAGTEASVLIGPLGRCAPYHS